MTPGTLLGDAVARIGADVVAQVAGLATGVVTARFLGPARKGDLATVTFIIGLTTSVASLGLGDAVVHFRALGARTFGRALDTALVVGLVASMVAMLCAASAVLALPGLEIGGLALAAFLLSLPLNVLAATTMGALQALHRVATTSSVFAISAVAVALTTWLLLGVFDAGIAGAALGVLVGAGVSTGAASWALRGRRKGIGEHGLSSTFVREAVKFGSRTQAGIVLTSLTARLDLLFVHQFVGSSAAGRYSVALTIAMAALSLPLGLSYALFPRLTSVTDDELRDLLLVVGRNVVLLTTGVATVVAATTPLIVPLLFGSSFTPAVPLAIVMTLGSVPASLQLVLTRAAAARGRPNAMMISLTISLATMVALDLALIPRWGTLGAAVASALMPLTGLWYIDVELRRRGLVDIRLLEYVPRWRDVRRLATGQLRGP